MSFNRSTISSLYALAESVKTPIPTSDIGDRDRFPAWQVVAKEERESGGERWLMRNGRGGLAWIHVDDNDMAYDYCVISDDEARELWPRLILRFRPSEEAALQQALRPGSKLSKALETALGGEVLVQGFWLEDQPVEDGTRMRQLLIHLRGIVRAWVRGEEKIVRAELVTGDKAWELVRPFIDSRKP